MDGYTGKRAVNGLVPGKGSGLILKDHVNIREQNPQFCNRIGCSRRLNSMKGTPNCYPGKAKCSKPSYHPSSSGKEIIGSSSGVYTEVSNIRKSSTNILRKLSSQLEIDSSETSSVQEEPEVSELLTPLGKIQGGLQSESEDSDSGEVTVMEVGSSSVASNTKRGRSFIQKSGLGNQDTLASPSVTLASRSAFQATQGNTSKYSLRNLRCDSISVVATAGCSSSDSSFSRRKISVKKRGSEGESSSSTWGKKLSGSSPEGLNNSSSLSVSISDSRRARSWSSNRDCGIASSVRTQRSNSSYGRGRLPNQANGNSLTLNESPIVIPQAPQSDIRTDMNAPVPIGTASTRTSSYSRSGNIDESLRSFMPSSPSEVSGYHSSVNRGSFQHYNMDGFAEVLLELERIEQDEELTYEQLLVLETSLLLNGLDFYDRHRDMRLDIDDMSYEELLALEERMGTVSTAVPEEALSKCLKNGIYKATSLEDANVRFEGEKDDIKCSICQEEYVIGDEVGRLHCEHRYHIACIQKWLRMKNWCPICKASAEPTQSCSPTSYSS
ncbi:putative E3 ubiquitin-protein ligase RHG1A [Gossypium australe]|uniref:RING-type E3 ubiquitin transferase n=1 Tax=Gossypium australe TaxID=47621 RepID=A0A5B6X895_9ROSI|nr:putative E3 ubiquitin-protein ligase RHG1A [Gossypium australe]